MSVGRLISRRDLLRGLFLRGAGDEARPVGGATSDDPHPPPPLPPADAAPPFPSSRIPEMPTPPFDWRATYFKGASLRAPGPERAEDAPSS